MVSIIFKEIDKLLQNVKKNEQILEQVRKLVTRGCK